jgi:hypothetical protein
MVAPRDVQRHPFKPIIEHVDLVLLSRREIRERLVLGKAMAKAEEIAAERELDTVAVQNAVSEILADEENDYDADQAIEAVAPELFKAAQAVSKKLGYTPTAAA